MLDHDKKTMFLNDKQGIRLLIQRYWTKCSIVLLLLASHWPIHAIPPIAHEYQIKAVFLYNFTYFIYWPQKVFTSPNAPFNICIIGHDPFRDILDKALKNETVEKHAIKIKRLNNRVKIKTCQVVFISQSEQTVLKSILGRFVQID